MESSTIFNEDPRQRIQNRIAVCLISFFYYCNYVYIFEYVLFFKKLMSR